MTLKQKSRTHPKRAINEIAKIYLRHKELPVLNNYLCLSYEAIGDLESVETITVRNYASFPRYIFAKTNYASICLHKGELDKIKEIFEYKSDLQSLYHEREVFHYTEFLAFMSVWAVYYYKIGADKASMACYKSMKVVDAEHHTTRTTKVLIHRTWSLWLMDKIFGKNRVDKQISEAFKDKAKQVSPSKYSYKL